MAASGYCMHMWSVLVLFLLAEGFAYPYNKWWQRRDGYISIDGKPIEQFALNTLCRTDTGLDSLFLRLKSRMCGLDDAFIESFMDEMCFHQQGMLVKWVAELYDHNQNGLIDYFEGKR